MTVPLPMRVLVVDDDGDLRRFVRLSLEALDYTVDEAADGFVALARCHERRPDVILLDVDMPGLDGYEVLSRLKADTDLAAIPVIFLTAQDSTDDVVEALTMGAHDHLGKPFRPAELQARLAAAGRVKLLQDTLREKNAELEHVSRTDLLTGMWNRRHLESQVGPLTNSSRRRGSPLAVVMADIDRFKSVNDRFGHTAGDRVLVHVANQVSAALRADDIAGRWGGEEFLIFLPATEMGGAAALGERLREAVAGAPMIVDGHLITPTVSIGCAELDGGESLIATIARADKALYSAKAQGRNTVITMHA